MKTFIMYFQKENNSFKGKYMEMMLMLCVPITNGLMLWVPITNGLMLCVPITNGLMLSVPITNGLMLSVPITHGLRLKTDVLIILEKSLGFSGFKPYMS